MKSSPHAQIAAPSEAQRAAYVAWLLRIDPRRIFPAGPESNAEADQHLVDWVMSKLNILAEEVQRLKRTERAPRFLWYRKTLQHCIDVMDGIAEPPEPNKNGEFDNTGGYRRGIYLTGREREK